MKICRKSLPICNTGYAVRNPVPVEFLGLGHLDRSQFFTVHGVVLSTCSNLADEVLRPVRRLSASIAFKRTFLTADLTVNCGVRNPSSHRNHGLKVSETIEWE